MDRPRRRSVVVFAPSSSDEEERQSSDHEEDFAARPLDHPTDTEPEMEAVHFDDSFPSEAPTPQPDPADANYGRRSSEKQPLLSAENRAFLDSQHRLPLRHVRSSLNLRVPSTVENRLLKELADSPYENLLKSAGQRVLLVVPGSSQAFHFRDCRGCIDYIEQNGLAMSKNKYGRPFWIDVQIQDGHHAGEDVSPVGVEALKTFFAPVVDFFRLHELTVEDCLTFSDTYEKFESFSQLQYSFAVLGVQELDQAMPDNVAWVHFVLTPQAVLTVHDKPLQCLPGCIETCLSEMRHPSHVLYTFLDVVVDDLLPVADDMLDDCESIGDATEAGDGPGVPTANMPTWAAHAAHAAAGPGGAGDLHLRINGMRRRLTALRRFLSGKQKLTQFLASVRALNVPAMQFSSSGAAAAAGISGKTAGGPLSPHTTSTDTSTSSVMHQNNAGAAIEGVAAEPYLSQETRLYLRDVLDHINSCIHKVESAKETLNQSQSNYLSQVSVQMARTAQATNDSMQRLALIATGFLPVTIITSAFGMNVHVPFQGGTSVAPFFLILLVAFLMACMMTVMMYARTRTPKGHPSHWQFVKDRMPVWRFTNAMHMHMHMHPYRRGSRPHTTGLV